ncbi:MAG: MBL fold metallo-hydrolase [Clostridiales bacterium]|nr:MBL fold metallo-hydrolase [Clostridiales bacterium]
MNIEYLGHSCFRITTASGTTILTDPYTKVGYELPNNLTADIVTISHGHFDHNYIDGVKGAKAVVSTAGKRQLGDIFIDGFVCNHDEKGGALRGKNIVFTISVDGYKICHLGDIGETCTTEILEKIGKVDVLMLPIGGTYTIDGKQAKEYVDNIAPKLTIPMHYKPLDGALDIADEKAFLSLYNKVYSVNEDGIIDLEKVFVGEESLVFMKRRKV